MDTSIEYYKLSADQIYDDVNNTNQDVIKSNVEGINLLIFPHVYPSHKFRTTGFVLRNLKELIKGKKICDMGCGPGIIGLFCLKHGAKNVIQADINSYAVENAKKNNLIHGYGIDKIKTYLSDCFDEIPSETFDIIVFNMPFHCEDIKITDPLKYAFYDPGFSSIKKFLNQAKKHSSKKTQIFIAFSNKGDCSSLEKIFTQTGYLWKLWKITNTEQQFDNRIYKLSR
jgi:methylase of polypeptide subunit release factors